MFGIKRKLRFRCAQVLSLCLVLFGCHPVPIQMARMHQIDFYKQTFDFSQVDDPRPLLKKLIGQRNYDLIRLANMPTGELNQYLEKIEARGALSFSVYLKPDNQDIFFVDAIGRYALIYNETGDILLSADFVVKNNQFSVQQLESGTLALQIQQALVRHSQTDQPKYFETDPADAIVFTLQMEALSKKKGVYRIKYEVPHDVSLNGEHIGFLHYDDLPANRYKVIDLRGRGFLKKDYDKYYREAPTTSGPEVTAN